MRPFCLARIKDVNGGCDYCLVDIDVSEKTLLFTLQVSALRLKERGMEIYKTRAE